MAFYIALLAASFLWMGLYGAYVDWGADHKAKAIKKKCNAKEPRRKEREDGWAA